MHRATRLNSRNGSRASNSTAGMADASRSSPVAALVDGKAPNVRHPLTRQAPLAQVQVHPVGHVVDVFDAEEILPRRRE